MNDDELGRRLGEQARHATSSVSFPGLRPPRAHPRARGRALLATAVAVVLVVTAATLVFGRTGGSSPVRPGSVPVAAGSWAGICDGSWKEPAPQSTSFTRALRFGGIVVQPTNQAPAPSEHQLRTRWHSDFLRPYPGSQLRYGLVTRLGLSTKPEGMWVMTTCGHLSTPDKPTPGNEHPQDRVYPGIVTYSLIDANLRWSQPTRFQIGETPCPQEITEQGVPDTEHPSRSLLVSGTVTGGSFCTYDALRAKKYPGSQRGAAGLPEDDARRVAAALNAVGGSGHEDRSCENPAVNEVDILTFSTSDGPQQVWIVLARCPRFTNGARVTGEQGAAYDRFREVLMASNAGNILRR